MTRRQPSEIDRRLGSRLRALREQSGWDQQTLADNLGIPVQQIEEFERGVSRISVVRLQQLSAVLNFSPVDFFQDVDAGPRPERPSADGVKVMMIPRGWEPPLEEKYALIEIGGDAPQTADLLSGTFRVRNNALDVASAIEDAREWAAMNGAAIVYVVAPTVKSSGK